MAAAAAVVAAAASLKRRGRRHASCYSVLCPSSHKGFWVNFISCKDDDIDEKKAAIYDQESLFLPTYKTKYVLHTVVAENKYPL